MKADRRILAGAGVLALSLAAGGAAAMDKKFGAPTEGMSVEEYQSLVFLDPQNTMRMDWDAVKGMDGYFLIDNQGEPTVSVVDYHKGETIRKLDMGETGNHHLWVIPGARYVWSSQRYESDTFWTIDLATMEVVDKFPLSMGDKKVIAPLHVGFAYTQPLAVVGNILDKEHGYLTLMSTVTRRPNRHHRDQLPRRPGRDVHPGRLEDLHLLPAESAGHGGRRRRDPEGDQDGRDPRWLAGRRHDPRREVLHGGRQGVIAVFDTATTELVKNIEVPGGGGNITCLGDSSKCYAGRRKAEAVAVLDMETLTLAKMIETGPDANRLYINPANKRYGLFANEGGKSDIVTIIDTELDVAVKNIFTGLGPHNIAYNPEGTRAAITTKKEPVATLVDTSSADPMDWDVVTTDLAAGIQNNGVRWVPRPEALKTVLAN